MEMYLIKSAACLAILLTFYKIFLEKESIHKFKRYYLLIGLLVSFTIPLITFTQYVEPDQVLGSFQNPILENIYSTEATNSDPVIIEKTFDWIILLWVVYSLGVLFFGIRFLLNLYRIVNRIQSNPKTKRQSFINVLLNDLVIPHTFFNYIFLNKSKFEKSEIPEEVLLHEQTHAKQKHSIDILLIEVLQVIFWFNPLIYLIKNIVKLNHEFLADQAVMSQGVNPTTYQQLLLAFSSNASEPELANAINYSSIKKRFTVMKTQTSKKALWLKSLVLLPLLVFMVYGFSSTKEVIKETTPIIDIGNETSNITPNQELFLNQNGNLSYNGNTLEINDIENILLLEDYMSVSIKTTLETDQQLISNISNSILDYLRGKGVKKPTVYVSQVNEMQKENISNKFLLIMVQVNSVIINGVPSSLETFKEDLDTATKNWEETDYTSIKPNILIASTTKEYLTKLEKEFSKTHFSKANEGLTLDAFRTIMQEGQKSATREEMAEYNKLAKEYNKILKKKGTQTFFLKDVERLKYLYSIMSDKQRNNAEPFPDFPKPPPPPEMPEAPQVSINDVPPPPPFPENATMEQKTKYKKAISNYKKGVTPPPPPPAPKAPPTIEEMAERGATFYLDGKRISSDEAIRIVNKNKDINIQIINVDSKKPTVKLSKKGIEFKKARERASINLETGNIKIKGKNYFYATKNGITSYFNNQGQPSDKFGNKLPSYSKDTPTFYYRGKQILSHTASKLLSRKSSNITVSTKDNSNGSYKIILTDTKNSIAKNYNNVNFNNSNPNSGNPNSKNNNLNNNYDNPNSVIDLTEVISKGAIFFYEDKKITTEKALLLTRSNDIERVQTIKGEDGKPIVYFWKKA